MLADLIAAGLVSHEMIGDPARLGGETEALRLLCALVAGPVWRIEPYHYAFRADPGGAPAARAADARGGAAAELGAEAVWVSATERPEATDLDQPLLLLRAQGEAVERLEAGRAGAHGGDRRPLRRRGRPDRGRGRATGGPSPTGSRRSRRGRRRSSRRSRRAPRPSGPRQRAEALGRLAAALGQVLQRLDAQADVLHAHIAREDMVAGRLAELGATRRHPGGLPRDARGDARRVPRPDREPRGAARRRARTQAGMSAMATGEPPKPAAQPRQTLAMRLAERERQRAERSERLARLADR